MRWRTCNYLCGACNSTKGAGTQAELVAVLRQRGILDVELPRGFGRD